MSSHSSEIVYSRRRISRVFNVIAVFILFSGLIVNPWTGSLYRGEIINYADVMLCYFETSIIAAALTFLCSFLLRKVSAKWIEGISVFVLALCIIALADRLLLAKSGLPLWIADKENRFKHRPNAVRKWNGEFQNKLIFINSFGQHDDEFPLEKGANEFRAVMLGDSITMGHGVTRRETFSNQLEDMLLAKFGDHKSFQIMNAGVQGYATFQEYNTLVDSLKFKPDFAVVQFCLNDLTEPFVVEKRYGGTGFHYQGIAEEPSGVVTFLLNETGFGRLTQDVMNRGKSVENEKRWEIYNTEKAAASERNDPTFSPSWDETLSRLDNIYDLAKEKNIRVLLLISPHTFQMMDERLTKPEKILTDHAASRGVDVIDLTSVFKPLIVDTQTAENLRASGFSNDEIENLFRKRLRRYFLDQDHYTVEGHRIVAAELFKYLSERYSF